MSDTPPPREIAGATATPDAAAPKSTPKSTRPRRPAIRVPATAALGALLILALALIGTSPDWAPPLTRVLPWSRHADPAEQEEQQLAQRVTALEQQLGSNASLSDRVATLENKPTPDASAAVAPLAAQVQQLSSRLDQIDARLAQLAHDEATNAESPQRVLMVALASLGNAVAGSRPFAAELASVEALGQSRNGWAETLQPLEGAAKTGIPSTAVLAQRFTSDVAPAILRAEAAGPTEHKSLGDAMLARLRGLVVIRRVDGRGGSANPTDRAVEEAQAALDKSDLAGAVAALKPLSGAPATAAQSWLADAQQRLDAEETIAKLSRNLAGDMAAGARGG